MQLRLVIPAFLALTTGLALVAAPAQAAPPIPGEVDGSTQPIFGGTNSLTCAWPSAVSMGGCSGTLVHPEVVIYAAHCGGNYDQIYLGERTNGAARTVATEYCKLNPDYGAGIPGTDHAFCKLAEPVTDVPIVPILMGCETSVLTPGREVVVVGFGTADIEPTNGAKSEVYTTLNGINNNEANIGGGGEDACFGDSGGPAFVKLPTEAGADGSWRVFGIVSYGSQDCSGPSFYSLMHVGMPWFESELAADGIDLTPCTDSEGNWAPTPLCQGFPLDPGTPYGSWANGCSEGAPLSEASQLCGPAFEPEFEPPVVTIVDPPDGSSYATEGAGAVEVTFTAEAEDPGSGIRELRLQLEGEDIPNNALTGPPWEWTLNLPPGGYAFNALAVDWSDNEASSDYVTVGVDEPAPEPPPEEPLPTSDDEAGADFGIDDGQGCACALEDGAPARGLALLALVGLLGIRRRRVR
ncbi:peptidase, S1 (chymotrypsin) family protein [Plesiocystis pacifica SIR-1]|uniref:Peptidase, S1 (Chymotrypsin) family protein n=1 Tax=Plesiocystis pacifica SIR-1 TaxID=391625 RepID=A6G5Z1_9BACT|nr:S1 family peptidase [Plesiocystis pacifica]EDM78765.1 peptidase, S1 (chymotrypsin) family protein [Plesiocystis pacifica SIR-1]